MTDYDDSDRRDWDMGFFRLRAGLAFVALAGFLCFGLAKAQMARTNGAELILETLPIDPRDLFFGYYATLSYSIQGEDLASVADAALIAEVANRTPAQNSWLTHQPQSSDQPLYVWFEKQGVFDRPVRVARNNTASTGIALVAKGTPYRSRTCIQQDPIEDCPIILRVRFELPERYYADYETAQALEKKIRAEQQRERDRRSFERCEKERQKASEKIDYQVPARCKSIIAPPTSTQDSFGVILSVDDKGRAVIKGLMVDGKRKIDRLGDNQLVL